MAAPGGSAPGCRPIITVAGAGTGLGASSGSGEDGLAFGGGEDAPVTRGQGTEPELADADADEAEGGVSDGGGHAADLSVFAFVEFEGDPAIRHGFAVSDGRVACGQDERGLGAEGDGVLGGVGPGREDLGWWFEETGAAGSGEVVADAHAAFELAEGFRGWDAFDLDPVFARVCVARVEDTCGEGGFIGEEEKAFGVGVEAADGVDAGWEPELCEGQLAGVIGCELGEDAAGFVEGDEHGGGVGSRCAFDGDGVESGELLEGVLEPGGVGQCVGSEGFDPAFLSVEEEGAVEAEAVGLG